MEWMSTEFGGLSATEISLRWSVIREICVIRDSDSFRFTAMAVEALALRRCLPVI